MAKYHLEHPTQATACGTAASGAGCVLTSADFDHVPDGLYCKACKRTLDAIRAGRKAYRGDVRTLMLTISSELADAIEHYVNTDWSEDPSKIGALNAVSYIGEQIVALYQKANGR
jgi:hypothetical protein